MAYMPDVLVEQTATLDPEQTPAEAGQPLEAATDLTAGAVSDEAQAAPASVPFDFSTDDGIKAAIAENPQLRGFLEKTKADAANAARQARDAELRRDTAATERVNALAEQMYERRGVDLSPEDKNLLRMLTKANEDYARLGLNKAYVETAAGHFGIAEQQAILASLEAIADDPTATGKLASDLLTAIHEKGKADGLSSLSDDEIKNNERIQAIVRSLRDQEVVTELNAREIEANKAKPAPVTPSGSTVPEPMTKERLDAMAPDQRRNFFASLPAEELTEWWGKLAPVQG